MSACECNSDGFCQRYNREMLGRMREICRNINVDLGTAATFREQWARETRPVSYQGPVRKLLFKTAQAPGDAVAMTAAIYSLHRANPGRFITAVETPYNEVFAHNPDVVQIEQDMEHLQLHYPAIHLANTRGIHFLQGCCEFLADTLDVKVPLLTNRPRLYFSYLQPKREDFWLVCSGGKSDFTNKEWGHAQYQEVVTRLQGTVRFVQVGSLEHSHQRLVGTEDMLGKTTLRELFDLARRAAGILCGVSLLMHVAAALETTSVIIAGGREPVQWNAYPRQQYVHTVGALPCCLSGGCWKSRVVPLGDGTELDKSLCERPITGRPECMTRITPNDVASTVLRVLT